MARGADKGMMSRRIAIAHDGYEQTLPAGDRELLDTLLELRARALRPASPPADPPRPARLYRATQPPRVTPITVPSQRPAARLEEIKRAPLFREDLADDVSSQYIKYLGLVDLCGFKLLDFYSLREFTSWTAAVAACGRGWVRRRWAPRRAGPWRLRGG